jgi:putative membrane protein
VRQNARMHPIAQVAAVVAALIHAYFFLLESVWFRQPRVWARFGLRTDEEASIVRSFAYNQGFYNLFLTIGVLVGLVLVATGELAPGRAIVLFCCGSMLAAGVVLAEHNRAFLRVAALQAGPPAIAIAAFFALG